MQIRIVAVGQRITEWAQSAVSDYLSRFPRDFRVELREIRTEPRAHLGDDKPEQVLSPYLRRRA